MTTQPPATSHALRRISTDSILDALRDGRVITVTERMTVTGLTRSFQRAVLSGDVSIN